MIPLPLRFLQGGTEELIKALKLEFPDKILYNKRVTKMVLRRLLTQGVAPPLENNDYIEVTVNGEEQPRKYQAVINTTTLAALQKMDLTKMELRYPLKAAIRSLHYDTSSKVGMKFKKAWWTDPKGLGIKQGGLGKTDMPLRVWYGQLVQTDHPRARLTFPAYIRPTILRTRVKQCFCAPIR